MKRMLLALGLVGLSTIGAGEVRAQAPMAMASGESVVYQAVTPGTRNVTYGERYVVRRRPFKTVIRERPARYVTTTPPVVTQTRAYLPAPVVEQQVIQTSPVIQTRLIQPVPAIPTRAYYTTPY